MKSWFKMKKTRNKEIKIKNGNRKETFNLKITNWNLGPRLWVNKVADISHMVTDFKPDIAVITEANLYSTDDPHRVNITDYNITTTKDFSKFGISRLVVLTRKNLNFTIMEDKMEQDVSTIWIKIPRTGMKSFYMCAIYREHKLLNRPGTNLSGNFQLDRWDKTLAQWTSIKGGDEVLTTGDLNIDYLRWDNPDQEHRRLVDRTKDNIETLGFAQLVSGPTRFWPNTNPSLIDQVWCNHPEKIKSCKNITRPVADHNLVEVVVNLRANPRSRMEIMKRKCGKLDVKTFQQRVECLNWENIYQIDDANLAYNYLEENLKSILDDMIPISKIQPSGKNSKRWISKETKTLMDSRDDIRTRATVSDDREDWNAFRTLRNKVTNSVNKDKKNFLEKIYENIDIK